MLNQLSRPLALGVLLACAQTQAVADHARVVIDGGRPSSLPTQIPTTIESITGEQIAERINASDSEDALKYFPSLNVRKRYNGDFDHAVLASRASGTGNSARSLVYADGILLSNLLGNGASYTPRWGMVTPEEIARVDVLYGPFSAAYPGNAAGAVVDFQTRMPVKLEGHVKLAGSRQRFAHYASKGHYEGMHGSASLGDRAGALSWRIDLARQDSEGQPLSFANRLVSGGVAGSGGVPVTGAIAERNPANRDWLILGASGQSHTVQDHGKVKLAYALSPVLRASYLFGWWNNSAERSAQSYLRDASGAPVSLGAVNIGGRRYDLRASDLASGSSSLAHRMHGVSLKRHARDTWDWEVAASTYDYAKDQARSAGVLTDMADSGWHTLALKGIWRPNPAHVVDLGLQRDEARLRTRGQAIFNGNTRLESAYAQDSWRISEVWKSTLGLRYERWQAYGGELGNASKLLAFGTRSESSWSPKAALSMQLTPAWTLKASAGRAVRNPTTAELFQGSILDNAIINSDPSLKAERSWTGEFSGEYMNADTSLRLTGFHETTRDALYSQPLTGTINTVQNIGRVRTNGLELAYQGDNVAVHGLTVNASATYADSIIVSNPRFAASVGKRQPRVPDWRANVLASYHAGQRWVASVGVRYSGKQFGTLDNSDPHGDTYTGVSRYLVADVRLRYRFDKHWSAALGVDNLNNALYWAFHPYTRRTVQAELRFDL